MNLILDISVFPVSIMLLLFMIFPPELQPQLSSLIGQILIFLSYNIQQNVKFKIQIGQYHAQLETF